MEHKLSVNPEKVQYIVAEMGENKVKVGRSYQSEILGNVIDFTEILIVIETNMDALNLFHAGAKYGIAVFKH